MVRPSLIKPHRPTLSLLVRIGFPASIGQSVSSLGFAVVQGMVNTFGPAVIAAFGIGNRIQSLFHMPAYGISQGVAILVGKKLGEGEPDEADALTRRGMLISGVFISIGMTLVLIFGRYVILFFVNDPDVALYGVQMFWYTAPSVICFAFYTIVLGAFQGGGETRPVMTMNIVRLWVLRVPLCYLLPMAFGLGTQGLWLAMLLSNLIVAVWAMILFHRGSWKVSLYAR